MSDGAIVIMLVALLVLIGWCEYLNYRERCRQIDKEKKITP